MPAHCRFVQISDGTCNCSPTNNATQSAVDCTIVSSDLQTIDLVKISRCSIQLCLVCHYVELRWHLCIEAAKGGDVGQMQCSKTKDQPDYCRRTACLIGILLSLYLFAMS